MKIETVKICLEIELILVCISRRYKNSPAEQKPKYIEPVIDYL
jgi:hypothetical protein